VAPHSLGDEPRCILTDALMYRRRHASDNEGFIALVIFPKARKGPVILATQELAVSVTPAQKFRQSTWDTMYSGGVMSQAAQKIRCKF